VSFMADEKMQVHFVCEAQSDESPSLPLIEEIARELVEPAIPPNIDYKLDRGDFRNEPGTLDHYTVDRMSLDDLVIADLTSLNGAGLFILGARAHANLPIVYIVNDDHFVPNDFSSAMVVRYSINRLEDSVLPLREAIEQALADEPNFPRPQVKISPLTPREMRLELANRIEATAETIRLLRINSVSGSIDELIAIADELKKLPNEDDPSRLNEAGNKALKVLFALLDELSTQPGIRMAITGAIALIVGGTGAPGAAAFSAGLAFWYGKHVFTKFINTWGNEILNRLWETAT